MHSPAVTYVQARAGEAALVSRHVVSPSSSLRLLNASRPGLAIRENVCWEGVAAICKLDDTLDQSEGTNVLPHMFHPNRLEICIVVWPVLAGTSELLDGRGDV